MLRRFAQDERILGWDLYNEPGMHVAEEVCLPVPHRQVVLTIPKRLRLHCRFVDGLVQDLDSAFFTPRKSPQQSDQAYKLTYVDIDTFMTTF